jgi:hypothetical protein
MATHVAFVPMAKVEDTTDAKGRPTERLTNLLLTKEEAIRHEVAEAKRADRKFAKADEIGGAKQRAAARDAHLAIAEALSKGLGKTEPVDLNEEFDKEYAARFSPDATSMFDEEAVLDHYLGAPVMQGA